MTSTDRHQTPSALFDPDSEKPPRTAYEVYLEPPVSVLVWMTALRSREMGDREREAWDAVEQWRRQAVDVAVSTVATHSRVLKHQPYTAVGLPRYEPCRLQVTTVRHTDQEHSLTWLDREKALMPLYRPHEHVLIGSRAQALDGSGRWLLDGDGLAVTARMAQDAYVRTFRDLSRPLFEWRRMERADYDPGPPEGLPPGRWDTPDPMMAGWEIDHPEVERLLTYYLQHYFTTPEPSCPRPGPVWTVILAGRQRRNGDAVTTYGGGDDPRQRPRATATPPDAADAQLAAELERANRRNHWSDP